MLRVMLPIAIAFAALDSSHVAETEAFRKKHEEDYRRQYVPLAGLFSLKEGVNTVGSSPSSDVRLPRSTPASAGRLIVTADRVRFEPAPGARVMLKGRPVTAPVDVASDEKGSADDLAIGDISFWVHMSGDRRTVRVRDPNGAAARAFEGFHWFPYEEKFRVVGHFVKDPTPHPVKIPNQLGDEETYTTEGIVEFTLEGQKITMRPMTIRPGRLYFIFKDGTSGKETYETARFLYSDLKDDGTTVLDFNQAYNPPCSFSPYTTCPLPPRENRLTVRILAGERAYPHPPKAN